MDRKKSEVRRYLQKQSSIVIKGCTIFREQLAMALMNIINIPNGGIGVLFPTTQLSSKDKGAKSFL